MLPFTVTPDPIHILQHSYTTEHHLHKGLAHEAGSASSGKHQATREALCLG